MKKTVKKVSHEFGTDRNPTVIHIFPRGTDYLAVPCTLCGETGSNIDKTSWYDWYRADDAIGKRKMADRRGPGWIMCDTPEATVLVVHDS